MRQRILDASLRVLADDGALRFTTTRVAEAASISVGSLYQYFPNKHALVAALHDENIEAGWHTAIAILDNPSWSGRRKLHEITRWFFTSEAAEAAQFGAATGDIDVFLHDQTGGRRNPGLMAAVHLKAEAFVEANAPTKRGPAQCRFDADFLVTTVTATAKAVAARPLSKAACQQWADRTASMLADHLDFPSDPAPSATTRGSSFR